MEIYLHNVGPPFDSVQLANRSQRTAGLIIVNEDSKPTNIIVGYHLEKKSCVVLLL